MLTHLVFCAVLVVTTGLPSTSLDQPWTGGLQSQKQNARVTTDREIYFTRTIRQYIQDNPEIISELASIIQDIENGNLPDSNSTFNSSTVCPNQGPDVCSFGANDANVMLGDDLGKDEVAPRSLLDMFNEAVRALQADAAADCTPCIALWTLMQNVACSGVDWETVRDALIPLCEANFVERGWDPVMCNGTLTLQGIHVFCIIQEANVREYCESLNECYPPDTRFGRPPVSERTPWAVKDSLEREGWKAKTSDRPTTKTTKDGLVMVAQLNDIHVQTQHKVGYNSVCNSYVCCLEGSMGTNPAREYGEYQCNIAPQTLELFLERVRDAEPDFVMFAGDSPPHTVWDESLSSQLNCSKLVVDAMARTFPEGLRVYPAIGNHEMFPTNLYSLRMDETKTMMEEFRRMWHSLADFDDEANTTMSDLSYYTMTVPGHPKLRIMSINTNYDWYTTNFYSTLNQHTDQKFRHNYWVEVVLGEARAAGEKVIILGHHPIGRQNTILRASKWWEEVANAYSDVIVLHVAGHTHYDHFKMSFDPDTMTAKSVNLVAASTTSNDYINPSMRMYYLDPEQNYTLVDFENFYLDIKTQNASMGVAPAIQFSYSALEHYQMPDVSPNSWKELVLRFIDDEELFQKYRKNMHSHALDDQECNYTCKVHEICQAWFPEIKESDECETLAPPEPVTTTTTKATTTDKGEPPDTGVASSLKHTYATLVLSSVILLWATYGRI